MNINSSLAGLEMNMIEADRARHAFLNREKKNFGLMRGGRRNVTCRVWSPGGYWRSNLDTMMVFREELVARELVIS